MRSRKLLKSMSVGLFTIVCSLNSQIIYSSLLCLLAFRIHKLFIVVYYAC